MKQQLAKDIQKSFKEISTLYWVTSQINDTHDISEIFNILVNIFSEVCAYESIVLRLYNDNGADILFQTPDEDVSGKLLPGSPLPEEMMEWILENRKIRIIPLGNMLAGKEGSAMVIIPLITMEQPIGYIQILMPISSQTYTPHLEQILWIVANQAAAAIQNARLFEQLAMKNETLNETRKYLTSVLDNMIHGVMVLDNKHRITVLSKSMEFLFQIGKTDLFGMHYNDVFTGKAVEIFQSVIDDINKYSFVIDREFEHKLGGKRIPISITASLLDIGSKHGGIIFVVKDLSSSKQLIALAELDKLKSNFVSTVSHEFKTPLNLILGSTNLLLEGLVGTLNEKQLKLVKLVKDGSNRLMGLVKDLLSLAKIEAQKGQLNLDKISLKKMIETSVETFRQIAGENQVTLDYEFPENVDDIIGDEEKFAQMLKNIISNGIKYNHSGGCVKVSCKLWHKDKSGKFVVISVKDNGIGIQTEDQEIIFNEFQRSSDPEVMKREGSGLGLTIAKKVVELHRGKIILKSKKGKGTEVKIIVPRDLRVI